MITFEQVGPLLEPDSLVKIDYQKPDHAGDTLRGNIPVLDVNFGNAWTNIPKALLDELNIGVGDLLRVRIYNRDRKVATVVVPFENSFGGVKVGRPLAYVNSLMNFSLALNQGDFAKKYHVESGADWHVDIEKLGVAKK